jgi:ATP-dependent protease ClpP protease subunit
MGNAKDFRGMADIMEMMDKDIAETYVAKAGGEAEDWLALMDKETWFDAESALQAGLIDEIIEMKKKYKDEEPKASVISPNVQILARETARRIRLRTRI